MIDLHTITDLRTSLPFDSFAMVAAVFHSLHIMFM